MTRFSWIGRFTASPTWHYIGDLIQWQMPEYPTHDYLAHLSEKHLHTEDHNIVDYLESSRKIIYLVDQTLTYPCHADLSCTRDAFSSDFNLCFPTGILPRFNFNMIGLCLDGLSPKCITPQSTNASISLLFSIKWSKVELDLKSVWTWV